MQAKFWWKLSAPMEGSTGRPSLKRRRTLGEKKPSPHANPGLQHQQTRKGPRERMPNEQFRALHYGKASVLRILALNSSSGWGKCTASSGKFSAKADCRANAPLHCRWLFEGPLRVASKVTSIPDRQSRFGGMTTYIDLPKRKEKARRVSVACSFVL